MAQRTPWYVVSSVEGSWPPSMVYTSAKCYRSILCAGMAVLMAGASTVCLCENNLPCYDKLFAYKFSRSSWASVPTIADTTPLVLNEHIEKWILYTDKGQQAHNEVQSTVFEPASCTQPGTQWHCQDA